MKAESAEKIFYKERLIAENIIGDYSIYTFKLDRAHYLLGSERALEAWFETEVFNDVTWDPVEHIRYRTLEEAEKGHEEVVKEYKEKENESTGN